MITYRSLPPRELTVAQWSAWSSLQSRLPEFGSPYFRPEFTRCVAAVRDDVEVGVIEQSGEAVGFLPFQRCSMGVAVPCGGRLSDFHGVLAEPGVEWNMDAMLRGFGLIAWDFHHQLADQKAFESFHDEVAISPYLDLSQGFDAYAKERRKADSDEVPQTHRKQRKLEREVGPVRFMAHTDSSDIFRQLIKWKEQQYEASGFTNVFSFEWTRRLLEEILAEKRSEFAGMMSTLHVGDRLLAIHYGMRSGGVLHSWFPAYDKEFYRYSPGLILLINIAQRCEELGIARIDLGRGSEQFKTSLMSGAVKVAEGAAELWSPVNFVRSCYRGTRQLIRNSGWYPALRGSTGWFRRLKEWFSFK